MTSHQETDLPLVAIVSSHGQPAQFPRAVAQGLESHGFRTIVHNEGAREMLLADVILFMGSLSSMRRTAALMEKPKRGRPPTIAWLSEPLPPAGLKPWAEALGVFTSASRLNYSWAKLPVQMLCYPVDVVIRWFGQSDYAPRFVKTGGLRFCIDNLAWLKRGVDAGWISAIASSTEQKRMFLKNHGLHAHFVPVGQQAGFGRDLGLERDIDVLFIGRQASKLRSDGLSRLAGELHRAGFKLVVAPKGTLGETRTILVNRARIMLHVHNYQWDTPWMRWCLSSANGAAVASEPLSIPDPMRPHVDYISAPLDQLAGAIIDVLRDEPRRLKLVENCRTNIEDHMTLDQSVARLAALMRDAIAKQKQAGL